MPVHLPVGDSDPRVDAGRIGACSALEGRQRVGSPAHVGLGHRLPYERSCVTGIELDRAIELRNRAARIAAPPLDQSERFVSGRVRAVQRDGPIGLGARLRQIAQMHVSRRKIDARFEPIGLARDYGFEQRHAVGVAAGGDVYLTQMRHQDEIVRLLPTERFEDSDRLRKAAVDDVCRRVLQQGGVAAPERQHLVGPGVAPLRRVLRANLRRRCRLLRASELAVRRAEQLQRITFSRRRRNEPLEQSSGALILVPLQVHTREADPTGPIRGIDFGGPAECALGLCGPVLVEKPEAEAPIRRRVLRIQIDHPAHVANRIVRASEPRFDGGEMKRPLRFRRLHCRRVGVGGARRAHQTIRLAHHAEAAPARSVARVLRDALSRLADDVGDLRCEGAEIGKRGWRQRTGAERSKRGGAREQHGGCRDRNRRMSKAEEPTPGGRLGPLGSARSGH